MTSVMRAAVLVSPGRIEMREHPMPRPEPGGVVVRVRVALTDGTDLKAFRRGHPQMPMPTLFGHEFSGDVVAVGEGVRDFAVGDAVACVHSAPCAACFWCERGEEELCERVMSTKILGAYAEHVAVPAHIVSRNMFRKPASLPYEAAAFLEPLACVVHSLRFLGASEKRTLVVIGAGGFGLLHAMVARAIGVPEVLLVGRGAERLALARSLDCARIIDSERENALDAVAACTGGRGADAAIECTGAAAVWEAMPSYVRRGGVVSLFGGLPSGTRVAFDAARLHYDEVRLMSPFHFTPRAVREAFDLLASGVVNPLPLLSERMPLERLTQAFEALDAGCGIKYAIVP